MSSDHNRECIRIVPAQARAVSPNVVRGIYDCSDSPMTTLPSLSSHACASNPSAAPFGLGHPNVNDGRIPVMRSLIFEKSTENVRARPSISVALQTQCA